MTYHMRVSREYLLRFLDASNFRDIVPGAATLKEAMDFLANGPEWFPLGGPCEGFTPEKGCPGHTKTVQR